jgi:hypothetical protein
VFFLTSRASRALRLARGLALALGLVSETFTIDGTFKMGWMVADVFLTGFIGVPIDIATG